jgi:hypothetical protein
MYPFFRNVHLLLASVSLPFLLMYGLSAIQMSHSTWFTMKPVVHERDLTLERGQTDARVIARAVMERAGDIKGELSNVQAGAAEMSMRIIVPGTVHDVRYESSTGSVHIKTSVAGVMGMLNRLHHWAGFWHEPLSMKLWATAVAVVSTALLLLGVTGIYMWFVRRAERRVGVVLLAVNLLFAITVIAMLRASGP